MADNDRLDTVRLDEAAARRLLDRATELDARLGSQSTVADLRDAARAAGISEEAFGRALAEMQDAPPPVPPIVVPQRSGKRAAIVATVAVLVVIFGFFALRVVPVRVAEDRAAAVERAPEALPAPTPVPSPSQPAPAAPARRR